MASVSRNIEIKATVKSLENLIKKAKELSESSGLLLNQEDTFFTVPHGRLKLRSENTTSKLIYYERPDADGPKLSTYSICDVSDEQGLKNILTSALGVRGIVKKSRQLFLVGQTRIHVDSVEGLGDFMELEIVLTKDQSPEDGQIIANTLMDKLGIAKEDLISGAYMDLLLS